jgi:hypothetical protein
MHNYKFLKMIGGVREGAEGWGEGRGELGKELCGGVV